MSCLTVYTDASWDPKTKTAGYGFWCRDHEVRMKSASAEKNIRCNTFAEIRAIAYAFYRIMNEQPEILIHKKYCTVVTDSTEAIKYYLDPQEHKVFDNAPRQYVLKLMQQYGITFNVKKVKAHHNGDGARSWVNNRVDAYARKARTQKDKEK